MKRSFLLLIVCLSFFSSHLSAQTTSKYTIDLARSFSRDIFETNGVPFLEPMVTTVNATSNSGFFSNVYVPPKVKKAYFRISVHTMTGFVNNRDKSYNPYMPNKKFNSDDISKFATLSLTNPSIQDTAGLIHYFFLNLMYDGIYGDNKGTITIPDKSATVLGGDGANFHLPNSALEKLVKDHPIYALLDLAAPQLKDSILSILKQFPENFSLPKGTNMNSIVAAVPQFEIGSLWGTEALIRFIPKVNLGKDVGDFMFWGFGLKHNISQYFHKEQRRNTDDSPINYSKSSRPFDLSVQAVYQGTKLENEVGVTKAHLTADATIWNVNVQFGKSFEDIVDVYSAISYDRIDIKSKYVYLLPVEIQRQLGMLDSGQEYPTEGFPGDLNPQTAHIEASNSNVKWVLGLAKDLGDFRLFADYSISKFNIIHAGLAYKF